MRNKLNSMHSVHRMTENDLKLMKMEKDRMLEELEHYKELSSDFRKNFNK